ncbi:MAG: hypothetical protein ACTHL3_00660 [Candidatus Nitrosocosmicus sp.]
MSYYNILISIVILVFILSVGIGMSNSRMSYPLNNSSSLSPEGIVNGFMSIDGSQLPRNNDSQYTGVLQKNLTNNTHE